jgi:hypothetical protein
MSNPNVRLAVKTMAAIEAAIEVDQGNAYRGWLGRILPHIGDAYRNDEDGYRTHLGASVIGRECPREVYYKWRWFTKPKFSGRMLRLFNRGHIEEGRVIAALQLIGCQVYQQGTDGKQFKIIHAGGHIGGSGDGVVVGAPDLAPGTPALCEVKTHGEKSFVKLKENGVREAKPEHYVQMTIYMEKMGVPTALYIAVNKNTDEFYIEIVVLNRYHADEYLKFGESIVFAKKIPDRISNTSGYYKCRFCDERSHCHKLGGKIEINCRTCSKSEALPDGTFLCTMHGNFLTKADQIKGCEDHTPI